jgi:hypothetical protein
MTGLIAYVSVMFTDAMTTSMSVGAGMAQRSAAAAIRAWSLCIDVRHSTPLRAWIVPQLGPQPSGRDLTGQYEAPIR